MHIHRQPQQSIAKRLLAECNLPTSDLGAQHFEHFFGCGPAEFPEGVVGVELYGSVALLRSLAVAEKARGIGCGRALVAEAELHAWTQGVRKIYLLTTTAEGFFADLGYQRVARALAPEAIRNTKEFSSLCPASSAFMVKKMKANHTFKGRRGKAARP